MMNKSRLFAVLLAALLMIAAALPAYADLIVEPKGSFYEEHADECTHTEMRYYMPKVGVAIALYNKPNGRQAFSLPTGAFTGTQWFYTDENDVVWGYNEHSNPEFTGWFKLLATVRLYDGLDFEAEHASEYFEQADAGEGLASAVFYMYPQGPLLSDPAEERDLTNAELVQLGSCYKDAKGNTWREISYCYGQERGWICIDDPLNPNLASDGRPKMDPITGERLDAEEPEATHADTAPRQTIAPNSIDKIVDFKKESKSDSGKVWTIVGVVAAAAAVCAAVLVFCFRKKGKVK